MKVSLEKVGWACIGEGIMEMFKESESGGLGRRMRSKHRCSESSLFLKRLPPSLPLPAPVKNFPSRIAKMQKTFQQFSSN